MSTWRKSGLANYKKRHSELSKRFHIGWIYIYIYIYRGAPLFASIRNLNYLPKKAPLEYVQTTRRRVSTIDSRSDVLVEKKIGCPWETATFTDAWDFPFLLHSSEIFLFLREKSLIIPLRFPFLSPFFFQIILVFQQFSFYIYIYME